MSSFSNRTLEDFLMTKFSSQYLNDTFTDNDSSSETSGWESRWDTLTLQTFRKDNGANSQIENPRISLGTPHSPRYEPNAYRPVHLNKQEHLYYGNVDKPNTYCIIPDRVYTYIEEEIDIHLNEQDIRVGFAISDTCQASIVKSILSDSPAEKAGLNIEDEIIEINGIYVEKSNHSEIVHLLHKCIKSRSILLTIRRKHYLDYSSNDNCRLTKTHITSVDSQLPKKVEKRLKRTYSEVKTCDMESNNDREMTSFGRNLLESQNSLTDANGITTINSEPKFPPLEDQLQKMQKYEQDLIERRQFKGQKARESEFLRTSLRGSKRLRALEKNANKNDQEKITDISGYENKCYISREEDSHQESETIQLKDMIMSVNRLTEHLKFGTRENDSEIADDYFPEDSVWKPIKTSLSPSTSDGGDFKIVKLIKEDDGYIGVTVRNDGDKVIIGRVVKGGMVEKSKLLHPGDEIVEVNGCDLRGRTVGQRDLSGEVIFVIVSCQETKSDTTTISRRTPAPLVQHMRALFDYEPEDDIYVPCKELALKFQKGDILHVLSTTDENWWQAYREGDDPNQNLAGLIPSSSFQQQLIRYNRELDNRNSSENRVDNITSRTLFGCRKKRSNCKKITIIGDKPRRNLKSINEMSKLDKEDSKEEAEIYENVSLYLSRTGRKRPIVLCGPEGVGCLELRLKMLESNKNKFAAVVPHTSRPKRPGEQDGVHYHFVSRQQFQQDWKRGAFVEWGEYKKHFYGTAFSSIRVQVARGRTCLLTLKPQSFKSLRCSDLIPYIVFISPPSLQQLRRQKEKQGDHQIRDDDLKTVLQQGKTLESKYGHLFDKLVVNIELERSLNLLLETVQKLETEPQWVPSLWLTANNSMSKAL